MISDYHIDYIKFCTITLLFFNIEGITHINYITGLDDIIINLNFNNGGENDQNLIKKLGYINSESNIPAVKFLGIYIDNKLNFEYHIKYIQKKISNSLFVINRVKKLLNERSLKTLYTSLIQSHLEYGVIIWSTCNSTSLQPLIRMQKKAIRIISNAPYNSHTEKLFKKHNFATQIIKL